MEKRFINPTELSQYLGLSPDTVYSWIWQKKIPHHKLGRLVRFDLHEIDGWMKAKKIQQIT